MDERDLEDKLTDFWEHMNQDVLQTVFFGWTERLEWVIEYERDYYINPPSQNKNLVGRSREKQVGS
jgi:hypothetical protein